MPVSLYLDSSDYSVLSDPGKAEREAPGVLEILQRLKNEGIVEIFFSAIHLTEMAPVEPRYTDAAIRRGNLLEALCGGNCMIHPSILFRAEVSAALGHSSNGLHPFRRDGKWFPDGAGKMIPITEAEDFRSLKHMIDEVLPNATRAQKREAQRKLTKKGSLRPVFRNELVRNSKEADLSEILSHLPMRPDAARVLARYVARDASAADATAAFESSLRDPRWMLQLFEKHSDEMTPFIEWTRGPAAEITEKLRELDRFVKSVRANPLLTEETISSMFGSVKWEEWQANFLVGIANRFGEGLNASAELNANLVDLHCPGISTAIRSSHSAWRTVTLENARRPKESDFADALHAAYAPDVDVFRADGFMANHIAKHVDRFGTTVVPKLSNLPKILLQLGVATK